MVCVIYILIPANRTLRFPEKSSFMLDWEAEAKETPNRKVCAIINLSYRIFPENLTTLSATGYSITSS